MSKSGTLNIAWPQNTLDVSTPQIMSDIMWTEPIDTTTPNETSLSEVQSTICFEIWCLVDSQPQSIIAASFCEATQILFQTTIVPVDPNLLEEEDPLEDDPWMEMPPLFVRDTVLEVEYMGLAKPLDFDWDDVLAED